MPGRRLRRVERSKTIIYDQGAWLPPLNNPKGRPHPAGRACIFADGITAHERPNERRHARKRPRSPGIPRPDRKNVVKGKSVSVRVDTGGRRSITKKHQQTQRYTNNITKRKTYTTEL